MEHYTDTHSNQNHVHSSSDFNRIAGQISFPAGSVWNRTLFGVIKSTYIDRAIIYQNTTLNADALKRIWFSGGISLLNNHKRSSVFMAGIGLNSDWADFGSKDWNSEWLYTYKFLLSPKFSWGIGADVQQYFSKWVPYPLLFINWQIADKTKFCLDADYLELRQFWNAKLAFTAGIRFNLEFFALKKDASYEYNTAGAETGIQYALGKGFYFRLKYKELIWGRETLELPDGSLHRGGFRGGRSLRLNFAYGI